MVYLFDIIPFMVYITIIDTPQNIQIERWFTMMDENKLYPQVKAIGRLYKVITDVCPQAEIPDPEMRPMRTYTMAILRLHQNRKSTPALEKIITELSNQIDADDWDGIFDTPISLSLRNAFNLGFYKGIDKTNLATIRKRNKMTQVQLSEAIGVTQKDISRWENKEVTPNAESLKKLAEALQCSIDDLL